MGFMQPSRVNEKMLNRGLSPIVIDWKTILKAIARIKRQLIGTEDFLECPFYPKKGTLSLITHQLLKHSIAVSKTCAGPTLDDDITFYCYIYDLRWSDP